MTHPLICLVIGGVSGALAAIAGVGGGIVMVPAFVYFLGMGQKNAAATSLAVIIFTSIAASIKNSGNQLVDWRVVLYTALSSAVIAWFAADLLKQLSNEVLTRAFAVLVICIGFYMLLRK
jgi:uncharacterized membrane protein YfcA